VPDYVNGVEFHHMLGVEHFIIYDNDSTDLPIEVVQVYVDQGLVTWIPWPPKTNPPPFHARTKLEDW
jgi:Glycosyltransferase family 92